MPALQVRLVKSWAGTSERIRGTLEGLGLYKIDDVRVVPDTKATRGMVDQVGHMIVQEQVSQDFKPTGRRHSEGLSKAKARRVTQKAGE